MKTPIYDFVKKYKDTNGIRLHMPGHKGKGELGVEALDITEITGADCLYASSGIIKQSEENLTEIFDTGLSVYSCEGSSLSLRVMLYLAKIARGNRGNYVLSARNAHSSFISAAALLDFDIKWLFPTKRESYISCTVSVQALENELCTAQALPFCVFITSPDYLGNIADISALSRVCDKYGVPLLVDNAHGAYLKFLSNDTHPITLGASMCCDSAHKTLPVLTGGGYLHISKKAPGVFVNECKNAFKLFGSTSPSYLILSSLDLCNRYLSRGYGDTLSTFVGELNKVKGRLRAFGFDILDTEPLKITVSTASYGYSGMDFAAILERSGIIPEMYDINFVVLMLTPENGFDTLKKIERCFYSIEKREPIKIKAMSPCEPVKKMSVREAVFAPKSLVSVKKALGKVASGINTVCPPAVCIVAPGEVIDKRVVNALEHYGYDKIYVVDSE